ncbi:MAG: choline ABC transporter ATP-binding protein [Rhodocyclaceae bacterium]
MKPAEFFEVEVTAPVEEKAVATAPIVEFRNVDIVFDERPEAVLKLLDDGVSRQDIQANCGVVVGVIDASIQITEGEICVLMGLSGSGKSTLLRAVNGLSRVSRGAVLIRDGGTMVDITRCDDGTLRRLRTGRVAMVFQQFALLPWRTVRENVGFALELRGMARSERDRIVDEKLELVGLSQWADKYAHELSGGMQQRVGLARAFATDADILLMDEPFSALDPLIREHLQDELLTLQRKLKKTIIFVSHDLDEALKLGTHIAIMESGRIVQYGEPEEIVLHPANAYVREFVAHMNPLNVLRGRSLMTPVEVLVRRDGRLQLDWTGHNLLELDPSDAPLAACIEGRTGRLVAFAENLDLEHAGEDGLAMVMVTPDILLKTLVKIRQATGRPVLLVEDGRFVGVVGDDEIFEGMLHQTGERTADCS